MKFRYTPTVFLIGIGLMSIPTSVWAEGSDIVGDYQALQNATQLYVDIFDVAETITWTGAGTVTVTGPLGESMSAYNSGDIIPTTYGVGQYGLFVNTSQTPGVAWDVSVNNQADARGRLSAFDWRFNAGGFGSDRGTNSSFYALVPGGAPNETSVIELQLSGLAGYVYTINANRIGVNGVNGGRSVIQSSNVSNPEFPIYLQPPSLGTYSRVTPTVTNFRFDGGTDTDVSGDAITPCTEIDPGGSTAFFRFTTDVNGSFNLICDLDQDGILERTSADDLLITGSVEPGENAVGWTGRHNGVDVSDGTYDCQLDINVGEFHYVGSDIETSYPGMRLFEVQADGSRTGLPMFWNDELVQYKAVAMPNGELGLASSGEVGIAPGAYEDPAVANVNARSWGEFAGSGKGNQSYLDTWTRLDVVTSTNIQISAVDPTIDSDNDGLSDFEENCLIGSDPDNDDTDGDGVPDGTQYESNPSPGEHGGIESNGDRAQQLAERAVLRSRMSRWSAALIQSSALEPLLPQADAVPGATQTIANVSDLVDVTNADAVVAADWFDADQRRIGAVLLASTTGEHYEHSKPLCDRVRGSVIQNMSGTTVAGAHAVTATISRPSERYRDYTLLAKAFVKDGHVRFVSGWLQDDYPMPNVDEDVIDIQVWAQSRVGAEGLFEALVARMNTTWTPETERHLADDSVRAEQPVSTYRHAEIPRNWIKSATILGDTLSFQIGSTLPAELTVRVTGRDHGSDAMEPIVTSISAQENKTVVVDLPLTSEVTVELFDKNRTIDRVWLSDGVWTRFDDNLWGGESVVEEFSTRTCDWSEETGTRVGGCANVSGKVDQFLGVARHFARPTDLTLFESVAFNLETNAPTTVCFQSLDPVARACKVVDGNGRHLLSIDSFESWEGRVEDAISDTGLMTFTAENGAAVKMKVGQLAFSETLVALEETAVTGTVNSDVEPSGCSSTKGNPSPWLLLLVFATVFRRRRKN